MLRLGHTNARMSNNLNGPDNTAGREPTVPGYMPLWVIASHLSSTVTEPLLSLNERARREQSFEYAWTEAPSWARTCMAGVLSSLALSLADEDPWRNLSTRFNHLTSGPIKVGLTGALFPNGRPLRDWHSFTDILGEPAQSVDVDPCYLPVRERLGSPEAAFLVGWANQGWLETSVALHVMRARLGWEASQDALRYLIARRRAYGVPADDGWVRILFSKWAIWAYRYEIDQELLDQEAIDALIRQGALPWPLLDPEDPMHWEEQPTKPV